MTTKFVGVRLDMEVYERLREAANLNCRPVAGEVRYAILLYLAGVLTAPAGSPKGEKGAVK